jgi:hypothetical protein
MISDGRLRGAVVVVVVSFSLLTPAPPVLAVAVAFVALLLVGAIKFSAEWLVLSMMYPPAFLF